MLHKTLCLALALLVAAAAPAQDVPADMPSDPAKALELIEAKQKEVQALNRRASDVTLEIGKLASSGKIPQDPDAVKALQQMVDELTKIRERLDKIDAEIAAFRSWIEAQKEALPAMARDIANLRRNRWTNYIQFQYRDTDQPGGRPGGFGLRRVRIGYRQQIDPRTSLRISFDFAQTIAGTTFATESAGQLRDAFLTWTLAPSLQGVATDLTAGQYSVPLGFEIERSAAEREFPERVQYNTTMFAGERIRGTMVRTGIGKTGSAAVGVSNSLTFNDPEQRTVVGNPGGKIGAYAALRSFDSRYDAGISYFQGERAQRQVGWTGSEPVYAQQVTRRFLYLDATLLSLGVPGLFLRSEAMVGHDRDPRSFTLLGNPAQGGPPSGVTDPNDPRLAGADMTGYQLQLGYNINARNQVNVRYAQFDPNRGIVGNLFEEYGVVYRYFINPQAVVSASHEVFEDDAQQKTKRWGVTTVRLQFRF